MSSKTKWWGIILKETEKIVGTYSDWSFSGITNLQTVFFLCTKIHQHTFHSFYPHVHQYNCGIYICAHWHFI